MDIAEIPLDLPDGFRHVLSFVWLPENDGNKNDSAPGEAFKTSWGITQMTWDDAVGHGIVSGDFDNMTMDQAANIYLVKYWNALNCSAIEMPVAFCMCSDAILTGTGHVARMIQRLCGAPVDGVIGNISLWHIETWIKTQVGTRGAVDAEVNADEEYLASLAQAPKFIHGWTRREEEMRQIAYALINA